MWAVWQSKTGVYPA